MRLLRHCVPRNDILLNAFGLINPIQHALAIPKIAAEFALFLDPGIGPAIQPLPPVQNLQAVDA